MPTDARLAQLALDHAPLVKLHPEEEFLPMSPEAFIASSRLELAQAMNSGMERTAVFDPENREWDTDPGALDHFGVPVDLLERWDQLHVVPADAGWSRRPHDGDAPPDGHLFALQHRSNRPTATFDPADPPPCYWFAETAGDDVWISYWFFYGFSHFLWKWAHQGDWEHIRLRIRDGEVVDALFAVHEVMYRVKRDRLRFEDGRLVVYSARSRHATWWKPGGHLPLPLLNEETTWEEILSESDRSLLDDEMSDDGATWHTALDLRPLADQPWRHYAGAWGKVGREATRTGPLGAWQKRFLPPDREIAEEE